jgi:pyruvate dehydrogenase E2 component (dihydrolipoamide acetyltransferase)
MIFKLVVPGPIEGVDEVRVLQWHKRVGDPVERDQVLVELETEKTIVEIQSAQAGVLRRILVADGDWARLGVPLALVGDTSDEALPEDPASARLLATGFEVD